MWGCHPLPPTAKLYPALFPNIVPDVRSLLTLYCKKGFQTVRPNDNSDGCKEYPGDTQLPPSRTGLVYNDWMIHLTNHTPRRAANEMKANDSQIGMADQVFILISLRVLWLAVLLHIRLECDTPSSQPCDA